MSPKNPRRQREPDGDYSGLYESGHKTGRIFIFRFGASELPDYQIRNHLKVPRIARFDSMTKFEGANADQQTGKVGTKAANSAPSANRLRVRLGMRKPVRNAS